MNILAICTTSSSGSIAICKDEVISFSSYLDIKITHSERLMPQIDFGLKQCKITLDEIDLIAVANGPGSFTGLRIGLATAKGLCMGKQIPLFPVNTLELLAYNAFGSRLAVLPFIDAKMNEVYAALYSKDFKELIIPQNAKPIEFLNLIDQPVFILGDGIQKYSRELKESKIEFVTALPHQNIPQASTLISMALQLKEIPKYDFEFISDLQPYYLRKSQAEIVKEEKEKK
ncbi:MAG: tRNA (adenosine(37)-N6)-threonylcarbamoyltransferase complex dimerization subunit type 1 TsaB [Candidatus Cloacimonetes bacterium]|nr:tRNA (adenosine(37)-N6)-threonylcarbamoyltransferase complex dimerization subunit type 1 TsaB [Candidatus Cloacimonadota bacterium]MCF7813283.1 tRNA (adenosine(37)-N6)-threonylcarbamoyltransferase complex dimerization subunit type 1 TsaB [Candidatus Cloacimonadota bacterium]MCF7867358.1 tRNA (adenosine(37)-N6)-threonylcarbamoyltransferase complex dimerization subunit type 1 TsaB [Candidatus Cloacimonadota bacterium]MCF7882792.1 tRNA (adenosine(37)-N6)-threonylcarbamoyltransferase complex dime